MTTQTKRFEVPTLENVSEKNRGILTAIKEKVGMVPNIYATYALSAHALERYITFANAKSSFNNKEKEVINLVVSQVNGCSYCQAAHTAIGKMNGFTDEQIILLRKGSAPFDTKFDALVKTAKAIAENKGKVNDDTLDTFFNAGYNKENFIDLIVNVGEKTITNFLHNATEIPVDFPAAPQL
ncbi:carboxymuconolactone decarboxylase family protein [Mongoliitalea daihaiensis]|uniref:carboxymuconolactone decarboxylase family protein n=1 Tax=Mongoliitalea daihaiensis TaxID=2782006 RepID=UPI001F46B216|nr:carboxymuconolactone decarboxylase family protein [Mongoliitalea daihaiensis]UJP65767.1 carboxymuconolactone decarboxylase family protein [Mongoliitalea daihaiensis]